MGEDFTCGMFGGVGGLGFNLGFRCARRNPPTANHSEADVLAHVSLFCLCTRPVKVAASKLQDRWDA